MGSHPQFDRALGLLLVLSAGLFLLAAVAVSVRGAPEPAASAQGESGMER